MRRVVHCKTAPFDIYIGRGSKWGNPFVLGDDGTRDVVIAKYRDWIRTQPALLRDLPELRGKTLGCYCAPKECHGDVLVDLCDAHERYQRFLAAVGDTESARFKRTLKELTDEKMIRGALDISRVTIDGRTTPPPQPGRMICAADMCLEPWTLHLKEKEKEEKKGADANTTKASTKKRLRRR